MRVFKSKAEARCHAVQTPSDPAALMASVWPPFARAEFNHVVRVLCRAATLPGADGPRYFMARLTQLAALLRKRAARYGKTQTWSVTAPNGREILIPLGDPGAVAFKTMADGYGGGYEKALIDYVCARLGPGDVFVDIGAHVGYIGAFAAAGGATVFAIEIQRELIPLIEQLATINGFDTLRALHAGASDRGGLGAIPRMDVSPGAGFTAPARSITSEDPRSVADDFVPMIALDDAFGRDGRWPAVVKVDVEGHEIAVVDGARRIIAEEHTRFVVEFHPHLVANYGGSADQLLAAFPVGRWHRYQLTDDGLRPISDMTEVTPDPNDPNPKLVFEPRGAQAPV
ncbi:hypothetical protein GCM10017083_24910 [Thalassobaculum fulvum]|uniref:Methyltransferase FkbM domain-containing protein n=1 Tax=Thalassobaculum fulvum TaxID=1633335 RepID=A0A919CPL5_9PROT|nr:FkbM family methyltransferase [Thalassobaculum fulvum]GHD50988.1 hypothetical protein GCM10017083_24910 [Thalassobaculum fulvum]